MASAAKTVYPHISKDPAVCGGRACISGTRVRVMDVVSMHESGLTPPAAWQRTAIDAIRRGDQSKEWTAYVVLLGRGSLTDAPGRQWTDDMSGGR